jgi:hypothetical protein
MFLSDKEYQHVISIIDGKKKKSALLAELSNWTKENLHLVMYDYICDHTINGLTRLRIVLWNHEDAVTLRKEGNLDSAIQKKFSKQFAILSRKYHKHRNYQNEDAIFVCYETICDEIQKRILTKASDSIQALKKDDIWKIEIIFTSIHFFYETDEQIQKHELDGKSNALRLQCADIVKKYDNYAAFDEGVSCFFTSHQTLDEKYCGSMFYYMR